MTKEQQAREKAHDIVDAADDTEITHAQIDRWDAHDLFDFLEAWEMRWSPGGECWIYVGN